MRFLAGALEISEVAIGWRTRGKKERLTQLKQFGIIQTALMEATNEQTSKRASAEQLELKLGIIIMKATKVKHSFKKVSEKQVSLFPALASKLGVQRPAVEFNVPQFEPADLETFNAADKATMLTCLNQSMVTFAKSLFLADPSNWEFVPSESELTMAKLAASFERQSSGRVLTNETAGKFADWIGQNAAVLIEGIKASEPEYSATQLSSVIGVIRQYVPYSAKSPAILDKVLLRLGQIGDVIASNEILADDFSEQELLVQVYDALVKRFTKVDVEEITADSL